MYGCVLYSSSVVSRYYSSISSKRLLDILANMPKPTSARIAEAQRQRQQITRKSEKYGPSTVYLQVLGSGAMGAPNTLYLFTDQKRYLFNCGECTQRLAHEHKVKLSKLDHIFITSKTWKNIGGLPGLSLTLQDVGVPNITLHGPDGLDELYNATKRFVIMKDMNVTMAKCIPSVDYEDNVMTVSYVLLGPLDNMLNPEPIKTSPKKPNIELPSTESKFEEFINDKTDYYRSEKKKDSLKEKKQSNKPLGPFPPDAMKKKNEKFLQDLRKQQANCSIAYICTLKKRLGTLDLAKCVELGVKPGPMLGQLKNGQNVVLPDGTLIRSETVKTPDDPGPVFIVLDVPDISYLKKTEFQAHFDNDVNPPEKVPELIVHFTPPHVFHDPIYVEFMSLFGPKTRHLVLNSQNSCMGSEAVHRTQHKLHLLDPVIFPLLKDLSIPAVWNALTPVTKNTSPVMRKGLEELKEKIAYAQFQNIISLDPSCKGDGQLIVERPNSDVKIETLAGRTLTMFHLRPKRELDRSAEPKLHIQDYIQETMNSDGFAGSLEQFQHIADSMRYVKSDHQEYPKVVFLGTGSCIPSKTRNTSAIALHVDEDHSLLLDCGEGTFGQLVRFYGPKKVNAFLRTLKGIYISHLHADHHIGLIGVLQARRQAFKEVGEDRPAPVYLLAPGQIITWLTLYDSQFEDIKDDYLLIPNQNLLSGGAGAGSVPLSALGVCGARTCLVAHCPNAFGVALDLPPNYKLTYSGDTLPCQELVHIGENSNLLIHEATMEDDLATEARIKMHSTTTQAIDIGRQMNAQFTVLTHFSQRYARLPRLNANILNNNKTVGIAFDNMQITLSELPLLPHMYAPLQLMFAEHCVEMEMKAAQRQRRATSPTVAPSPAVSPKRSRQQPSDAQPVKRARPSDERTDRPNRTERSDHTESAESPDASAPVSEPSAPNTDDRHASSTTVSSRAESVHRRGLVKSRTSSLTANYRESISSKLRRDMNSVGGPSVSAASTRTVRSRSSTSAPRASDPPPVPHMQLTRCYNTLAHPCSPNDLLKSDLTPTSPHYQPRSEVDKTWSREIVTHLSSNYARSKPLRPSATVEVIDMVNPSKKSSFTSRSRTPTRKRPMIPMNSYDSGKQNAYGKPLVTPLNKKLVIKKDVFPSQIPQHITPQNEKSTIRNFSAGKLRNISKLKTKMENQLQSNTRTSKLPNLYSTNIRNYKPNLADIKSSYLLLNVNVQDNNVSYTNVKKDAPIPTLPNTSMFDEQARQNQLRDVKKKFQSKKYLIESKYDKIEGLNWISWK